jgi:hypothetical protein
MDLICLSSKGWPRCILFPNQDALQKEIKDFDSGMNSQRFLLTDPGV